MEGPDALKRSKLEAQRTRFHAFVDGELRASSPAAAKAQSDPEGDKSYAEIAALIADVAMRKRYVEEVRALLLANLEVARFEATPQEPETISRSWAGALALVAMALAWSYGPRVALLAGAFVYWMAAEMAHRRQRDENEAVREHNRGTTEAAEYVAGLERDLREVMDVSLRA